MCIVKRSDMIYDRRVDKLMDWERGVSNSKASEKSSKTGEKQDEK